MQGSEPAKKRRKHCLCCAQLFMPDNRLKDRQSYCSSAPCQHKRQRENERDWRTRHPDCLAYQREQVRLWHKARPQYSRNRRSENPALLHQNRDQTKKRMKTLRRRRVFDKSKMILTQITGGQYDECYLTHGGLGLYVRLTKASPLSKRGALGDYWSSLKPVINRLPRGELYDLSELMG